MKGKTARSSGCTELLDRRAIGSRRRGATGAEVAPSVLPLVGSDYLVSFEDGGRRRGVSLVQVGASSLAPEASMLSGLLTSGLQGDVTLLRTPRGYWFAWTDAGALGLPAAHRSFVAFLLPPS